MDAVICSIIIISIVVVVIVIFLINIVTILKRFVQTPSDPRRGTPVLPLDHFVGLVADEEQGENSDDHRVLLVTAAAAAVFPQEMQ